MVQSLLLLGIGTINPFLKYLGIFSIPVMLLISQVIAAVAMGPQYYVWPHAVKISSSLEVSQDIGCLLLASWLQQIQVQIKFMNSKTNDIWLLKSILDQSIALM